MTLDPLPLFDHFVGGTAVLVKMLLKRKLPEQTSKKNQNKSILAT